MRRILFRWMTYLIASLLLVTTTAVALSGCSRSNDSDTVSGEYYEGPREPKSMGGRGTVQEGQ